jgi:transcriptional regulator with XRE-family HTH domain
MPRLLATSSENLSRIAELGEQHIAALATNPEHPIVQMILHPENGELLTFIAELHGEGAHRETTKPTTDHFEHRGITQAYVAKVLHQSKSTRNRRENGHTGSAREVASELADLAPLLQGCPVAGWTDLFEGAYCEAISTLRGKVRESQGLVRGPTLSKEEFAFLWHLLKSEGWAQAKQEQQILENKRAEEDSCHSKDLAVRTPTEMEEQNRVRSLQDERLAKLFEVAARIIQERVKTTFPSHPSASFRDRDTLERLHTSWGLYFRIVLLARVPIEPIE